MPRACSWMRNFVMSDYWTNLSSDISIKKKHARTSRYYVIKIKGLALEILLSEHASSSFQAPSEPR